MIDWGFWAQSEIVADLGRTLFHSIWQITLITAALFAGLKLTRPENTRLRHGMCVVALVLALVVPLGTFLQYASEASPTKGALNPDSAIAQESLSPRLRSREGEVGVAARSDLSVDDQTAASTPFGDLFRRVVESVNHRAPAVVPFAVAAWMLGMLIFGIRLGGGFWQVHRFRKIGVEPFDGELFDKFERMCEGLGIKAKVKLVRSTLVGTPIAFGVLKPVILLPVSIFLQMSPREIELIVAHELAHIRRYDPLINILQNFAEVLLFYHPGIWLISSEIRREREFAADSLVTEVTGVSHAVYATALVNLEELRLRARYDTPRLATAADGGNLMQRVKRILRNKTEMRETRSAWPAGVALLLISAVVAVTFSTGSAPVVNADAKRSGRKLAIGFVSLPPVDRTENAPKGADATARLLIEKLKARRVPAVGFVLGGAIIDGPAGKLHPVRANIVRLWRDAGFEIGIGGYKHIWFAENTIADYAANVEKNERVLAPLLAEKGLALKYFSYPFLNTGKTHDDHVAFEKWLGTRGLSSVKYTIDNQEWMYSYAYDMALNDNDVGTMNEIRESFVKYMASMFDHFETYSQRMFGRDIPQTMVLTPSRLVADSADDLFGMIETRGYSYVPMGAAQADPAYQTEESFAGKSGISWFERWAMQKRQPLLDEPKVSKPVWDAWELRKKEPPKVISLVKPN